MAEKPKKLWGGRFSKKTDPLVEEFTSSINVDKELALYDVVGSIFHIAVLKEAGLVSPAEYSKMLKGLNEIKKDIKAGTFRIDETSEDIHSDIQNKLEMKIGAAALKLHTARSRNDQIIFDVKTYCKYSCLNIVELLEDLEDSMSSFIKANGDIQLPGYTHLQHAQPINLQQYFLSYDEMLLRDGERGLDLVKKIKISLGSGALAGTTIESSKYQKAITQINKNQDIKEILDELRINFGEGISAVGNSIDNVSDRDFIIEALSALAIIGMHLSRLAEDLIYSQENSSPLRASSLLSLLCRK